MNRLTKDDVKEMGMVDLARNQVFIKDGEAWYRDFGREISVRDLAKEMFDFHNIKYSSNLDEFDEDMMYLLEDDYQTIEGVIALFYRSLWAFADIRETLKAYEDTGLEPEEVEQLYSPNRDIVKLVTEKRELNNKYNTLLEMYDKLQNELKGFKDLEKQGLLHIAPVKDGTDIFAPFIDPLDDEGTKEVIETTYLHGVTEFEWGEINKNWFLTREEAEKALEAANERD